MPTQKIETKQIKEPVPTKLTHRYLLGAWGLGLIFALANIVWLMIDNQPQPMVDMYVEKIFNLSAGYREKSLTEYPRLWFWSSIGPRLPLYQFLAAPIVLLMGKSVDAILLVNSLSLLLLAIVTYNLAIRVTSPAYAFLATLFVLTFPLSVELSRLARPHAIAPLMVGVVLLQCWRCLEHQSIKNAWLLMAVTLLAFANHGSSLYLMMVPVLSTMAALFLTFQRIAAPVKISLDLTAIKSPVFLAGYLPAFSLFVFFVAGWTWLKWEQYQGLRQVIDTYFVSNLELFPLERALPDNLNLANSILIIGCILAWLFSTCKLSTHRNLGVCLFWLLGMFVSFHLLLKSMPWANFSGTLPLMAVIAAKGMQFLVTFLIRKDMRVFASILLLFVFGFTFQSYLSSGWGFLKIEDLRCRATTSECRPRIENLRKSSPQPGVWGFKELLKPIVTDSKCSKHKICTVTLVSHRSQYFSDEVLSYKLVQYFDHETRRPIPSFYPQRTINFKRLTAQSRPSSDTFSGDYILFLTDAKGLPRRFEVKHFEAGKYEVEEIQTIQLELNDKKGRFKLVKRIALPNGEFVHLVSTRNQN